MTNKKSPGKLKTVDVSPTPVIRNKSAAETNDATDFSPDEFTERMAHPGPEEEAFFERRRQLNLGAGIDENGNLVTSNSKPKEQANHTYGNTLQQPKFVSLAGPTFGHPQPT